MAQARRLADEVVFLEQGRAVEHSPARQFFQQPNVAEAHLYDGSRIVP